MGWIWNGMRMEWEWGGDREGMGEDAMRIE